jgi:hypothetical protein
VIWIRKSRFLAGLVFCRSLIHWSGIFIFPRWFFSCAGAFPFQISSAASGLSAQFIRSVLSCTTSLHPCGHFSWAGSLSVSGLSRHRISAAQAYLAPTQSLICAPVRAEFFFLSHRSMRPGRHPGSVALLASEQHLFSPSFIDSFDYFDA